jgi:hypothetical protein
MTKCRNILTSESVVKWAVPRIELDLSVSGRTDHHNETNAEPIQYGPLTRNVQGAQNQSHIRRKFTDGRALFGEVSAPNVALIHH